MTSTKKSLVISKTLKLIPTLQRKLASLLPSKPRRRASIGKQIRPLIDALNATGRASTTASCQGHGWPFIRVFPYVIFEGDSVFAAMLANLLRDDAARKRSLRYAWSLDAYLDSEFRPSFKMWLDEASPNRFVTRRHLDMDFADLSDMVSIALKACQSYDSVCPQP